MSLPRRIVKFLGLADKHGDISFNKSVTAVMIALFAMIVMRGLSPSPWVLSFGIVLVGAGFGLKGYLGGASRVTLTGSTNTTLTGDLTEMAKVAMARRDPDAGIDPA